MERTHIDNNAYLHYICNHHDAILIIDEKHIVKFCNTAAEVLFNKKQDTLIDASFNFPLQNNLKTEIEIERNGGGKIEVELNVMETEWNTSKAYFATLHDITKRKSNERNLKESREQLDLIINSIPVNIAYVDSDQKYLYANKGYADLWGVSKDEIIGKNVKEVLGETVYKVAQPKVKEALQGKNVTFENKIHKANGKDHFIQITLIPHFESNGKVKAYFSIVQDVTYYKEQERLIKIANDKFEKSFRLSPDLMFISTLDKGRIIDVNETFLFRTGYTRNEIIGKTISSLKLWNDLEQQKNILDILEEHSKLNNIEVEFREKSGETRTYLFSAEKFNLNGDICIISIARDINERKLFENAVKESEKRFREILEKVQLFALSLNFQGNITFINDYTLEVTGYLRGEVLGRNWINIFIPAEMKDKIKSTFLGLLINGNIPSSFENEILTKYGRRILVSWTNTIIRDTKGNLSGITSIGEDITEKRKAEESIVVYSRQMEELNKSKDKFFSILSHDLRNPFQGLIGFSQELTESLDTLSREDIVLYSSHIYETSKILYRLITDLLEWSLIQSGRMEYSPVKIKLTEKVNSIISILQNNIQKKEIQVYNLIDKSIAVIADKTMLNSIIENLLSNAIKFTPEHGEIVFSALQINDFVKISVKDSGIGIPPEGLDRIFKIDHKYTTAGTRKEKGTGLGLILCKEMVEINKGSIEVESIVGKGTTFIVTLPKPG